MALLAQASEERQLCQDRLSSEDSDEGQKQRWINLSLLSLLAVGLGLIFCMLVFGLLLADQPQGDVATVNTMAALRLPKASAPKVTPPLYQSRHFGTNISAILPESSYAVPEYSHAESDCMESNCRVFVNWLRYRLDYNADPCEDFYKYVCSRFRGYDQFTHLQGYIRVTNTLLLQLPFIPATDQIYWQKAAAMYQACTSFAESEKTETKYLVEWMLSLNLDLLNETRLATVNPVQMMVRGSLDLGVQAVISITLGKRIIPFFKRRLKIESNAEHITWLRKKLSLKYYTELLGKYGAKGPRDRELALKIRKYERHLVNITVATFRKRERLDTITISKLGDYTTPSVTQNEWGTFFNTYTNGTYNGSDLIDHRPESTTIIKKLFERRSVGIEGLRYLVAWTFYAQLFNITEPKGLRGSSTSFVACYHHINKVMNLAIISPIMLDTVPPRMVHQTELMVSQIRSAFEKAFNSSTWLSSRLKQEAMAKLVDINVFVGSQGRRLDPDFIKEIYKPYPNAPRDRLFPTWIKALSLSTHYSWIDQQATLFDETEVNARYNYVYSDITVTTGIMHEPFLYMYGPISLNFAGLGMIIGHEFMHAFDVRGIRLNHRGGAWLTDDLMGNYTEKAHCLRRSHRSVLSLSGEGLLSHDRDSENLADLVGTILAYSAYSSLPEKYKTVTLPGSSMSPEQLFFINHCVKWCAERSVLTGKYAPFRSRCIVPLMNMPEFSKAFDCPAGTPMNPRKKCTFW